MQVTQCFQFMQKCLFKKSLWPKKDTTETIIQFGRKDNWRGRPTHTGMNDTTKRNPRQERTTGFLRGRFLQAFSWDVTARLYTFVHVLGSCPIPILTLPIVGRMTNSAHRTAQHTHIYGQLCKQLHPMKLNFLKENEIQTVKALKFKNSAKLKVGHYENYQTCW